MGTLKCVHELPWQSDDYPNLPTDWYESPNIIVEISSSIGKRKSQNFVQLPFDTTLEGECLGAAVKWRENSIHGMLVENYKSSEPLRVDEILEQLKEDIILSQVEPIRRLNATKEAVSILKSKGHKVIFNVTGPVTVLSAVMGFENLLRLYIRRPEQVDMLFNTLDTFYDDFLQGIKAVGVDLISYADPLGNKEVLGGRYFEKWSSGVQVQRIEKMKTFGVSIHVCGNLSTALAELGLFPYDKANSLDFETGSSIGETGSSLGKITGLSCIHSIAQTERQMLY